MFKKHGMKRLALVKFTLKKTQKDAKYSQFPFLIFSPHRFLDMFIILSYVCEMSSILMVSAYFQCISRGAILKIIFLFRVLILHILMHKSNSKAIRAIHMPGIGKKMFARRRASETNSDQNRKWKRGRLLLMFTCQFICVHSPRSVHGGLYTNMIWLLLQRRSLEQYSRRHCEKLPLASD